jgi:hypothetical protein
MTLACARELYHQVNSFLAGQTNYSLSGIILKPCDNYIIVRCLGVEPARSGEQNNAMKTARPEGILVTVESTSLNGGISFNYEGRLKQTSTCWKCHFIYFALHQESMAD